MREVRKFDLYVTAFELGAGTELEEELLKEGSIIKREDHYEICSKEACGAGEVAHAGDFVKLDKARNPYPNARERFLSHHKQVGPSRFVQYPDVIKSWQYGEEQDDVITYLLETNQLIINHDSFDKFYEAELWGTTLTAKKIDIILIYSVDKDGSTIENVDFNLIDKEEFDKTYEYVN